MMSEKPTGGVVGPSRTPIPSSSAKGKGLARKCKNRRMKAAKCMVSWRSIRWEMSFVEYLQREADCEKAESGCSSPFPALGVHVLWYSDPWAQQRTCSCKEMRKSSGKGVIPFHWAVGRMRAWSKLGFVYVYSCCQCQRGLARGVCIPHKLLDVVLTNWLVLLFLQPGYFRGCVHWVTVVYYIELGFYFVCL